MRYAVHFANGLGNLVMQSPLWRALRILDPGAQIDLLLAHDAQDGAAHREKWAALHDLARAYVHPGALDAVHFIDRADSPRTLLDGYDHLLAPRHGENTQVRRAMIDRGAIAPEVTGGGFGRSSCHESEHYVDAARALGYRGPTPEPLAPAADDAFLPDQVRELAGWVSVCNGAWSQTDPGMAHKRWPGDWPRLIDALLRWLRPPGVLVLGGAREAEEAESWRPRLRALGQRDERVRILAGTMPPRGTCAALARTACLVTTDTGTMHLADAWTVPSVILWGPTLLRKNAPRGAGPREIVRLGLDCQPCQYQSAWSSCEHGRCMADLGVGDVLSAVRRLERAGALVSPIERAMASAQEEARCADASPSFSSPA